jgi:hypothetical protein
MRPLQNGHLITSYGYNTKSTFSGIRIMLFNWAYSDSPISTIAARATTSKTVYILMYGNYGYLTFEEWKTRNFVLYGCDRSAVCDSK